jgi:hypothetical protein
MFAAASGVSLLAATASESWDSVALTSNVVIGAVLM